ncbi:M23 family metallopeptidase [Streptomyces sp. SAI-041]|uniref:M23 family metallopeptidase n=1 Tax=Streptomyces sp. SAI-041 TaxID=2940548 RepID=UPI0024771824|nr:M23 family metallopeptidase [Streptomyces sp. SAI-041]MDH6550163.1 murein DD-endopeptidase MepM/ murein hydrolase activator NlpD [Streptomyces sp. SAI-041]
MRSPRRHPLLVPALLCACVMLAARPADAADSRDPRTDGDPGAGAQVLRLYQDAALATQRYEAGRQEAEAQRARTQWFDELLGRERREIAVLRQELGRIARAQYRDGGGLPLTAQIIFATDPADLMRGQHVFSRTRLAVDNAVEKSRRAEVRLVADEAKAAAVWRGLERRRAELAALKGEIEQTLEEARGRLQGQADASVAAGSCRGAVPLDQPQRAAEGTWVAPVVGYELSAGFGSGGTRWASRHTGQDFAVPIGTPVRAVGAGRVVKVSCGGAFGIEIVIEHADGYFTQYAHLAAVTVDQGASVASGQWIGQSGTSGNSTGPHLHFEVRVTPETGSAVDPVPWLSARGVPVG